MNKKYVLLVLFVAIIAIIAISFTTQKTTSDLEEISSNSPSTTNNNNVSTKPKPQNNAGSDVVMPKFITVSNLEGSIYRLKSYNGSPVSNDSRYTLSFEKGSLNTKFCNNINGPFVLDGGKITANNLVSTKMFCTTPTGVMDMETKFISILNFGAGIYQSGNDIVISSKDAAFIFTGFGN